MSGNIRQYDSEALKLYRAKAAEIAQLRHEVGLLAGELSYKEAHNELQKLTLRTDELADLRASLEPQELLMVKYGVGVIDQRTVSFLVPKGCSRLEILQEVQALVKVRDKLELIAERTLAKWQRDRRFTKESATSERICIDGHVPGGDAKSLDIQKELLETRGLQMATIEDLAVAFALQWLATGEPLLEWYVDENGQLREYTYAIRTGGSDALDFGPEGLRAVRVFYKQERPSVGIAARIFPHSRLDIAFPS